MLLYPITKDRRKVLAIMIQDPVLNAIISECKVDEKFLYVPEYKIKDKKLINQFINEGKLFRME